MNQKTKSRTSKVLMMIGLVIIGLTIGNRILFTHIHIMPDGSEVSHAHPFNQSKESSQKTQHTHSGAEFLFMLTLEVLYFLAGLVLLLQIKPQFHFLNGQLIQKVQSVHISSSSGRAPPCC